MDKIIYGGDTETYRGQPMTLQFYSEDVACDVIIWTDQKSATDQFFKWCSALKSHAMHVVWVHNLAFDLPEFLWAYKEKLAVGEYDFQVRKSGVWRVRGVYGTPTFCVLTTSKHKSIYFVDSFSYFRESLESAAKRVCPEVLKLKRPAGLGERKFSKRDTAFKEYAMRDAQIGYHLGKAIERMHVEFDVKQCVSVADMAARIFRHKFLSYTIPQPERDVIEASLHSYHGGKNNITVPPSWYQGVSSLDISSAYPDAMSRMPAFSNERLYKSIRLRRSKKQLSEVPDYGVYCVSGKLADCKWPVIFSSAFKPLKGDITDVWVQGFELNEALRARELKLTHMQGFYYDAEHDIEVPAMRNYVQNFYRLKSEASDPVLRYLYKLLLNSISGKFIQTRKRGSGAYTDIDADVTVQASDLIAGGLFHPFIASAITAHTRARIHQLEHKYKALHTATDGIMTLSRDAKAVGRGLGALTVEAKDATVMLIRNKLYVIYTRKGAKTQPSKVFKGKHIAKYALHGFQGNVTELERLIASNRRKYTVTKPNKLKESIRRGLTVNEFTRREFTLKVPPFGIAN